MRSSALHGEAADGLRCGTSAPNVGKSTLFNALTHAAAQAANYPFCTIEPNVGDVAVPDPRLDTLATIAKSAQIIPTRITFVDIAGLVRGASKGEGLGNQFLANIREVDAIAHVLRCFEDADITHVEGKIDPVSDADTVETELMLADLESLEKRIIPIEKKANRAKQRTARLMTKAVPSCAKAPALRRTHTREREPYACRPDDAEAGLYVCNVEEAPPPTATNSRLRSKTKAKAEGARAVWWISARTKRKWRSLRANARNSPRVSELRNPAPT